MLAEYIFLCFHFRVIKERVVVLVDFFDVVNVVVEIVLVRRVGYSLFLQGFMKSPVLHRDVPFIVVFFLLQLQRIMLIRSQEVLCVL